MNRVSLGAALFHLLYLNIHRNGDVSDASRGERCTNRQICDALHVCAAHHTFVVDSNVDKQFVESDILLRKSSYEIAMLQASNGQNRGMIHLGVIKTIQKMDSPRTGGRDTYP